MADAWKATTLEKRINLQELRVPHTHIQYGIDAAEKVREYAYNLIIRWQACGGKPVAPAIVVGNPEYASLFDLFWDDPEKLMGYAVWWGPIGQLNVYTAWRALRPVARSGKNTTTLVAMRQNPFQDETAPQEPDGAVLWGDNREAAACLTGTGSYQQLVGVFGMPSLGLNDWLAQEVAMYLESRYTGIA